METTKRDYLKNVGDHIMTLAEGERVHDPTSTKHEFIGAGQVSYTRHADGGITIHLDETTALRATL